MREYSAPGILKDHWVVVGPEGYFWTAHSNGKAFSEDEALDRARKEGMLDATPTTLLKKAGYRAFHLGGGKDGYATVRTSDLLTVLQAVEQSPDYMDQRVRNAHQYLVGAVEGERENDKALATKNALTRAIDREFDLTKKALKD